ncbi:hypothetical protein BLOT_011174 [Blomia tropicalis]|nr:hypothetical protein BLOT_011174 [Blomia tropicalis]
MSLEPLDSKLRTKLKLNCIQFFNGSIFEEGFKAISTICPKQTNLFNSQLVCCPVNNCRNKKILWKKVFNFERHIINCHKDLYLPIYNRWHAEYIKNIRTEELIDNTDTELFNETESNIQSLSGINVDDIYEVISDTSVYSEEINKLKNSLKQDEYDFVLNVFESKICSKQISPTTTDKEFQEMAKCLLKPFINKLTPNLTTTVNNFLDNEQSKISYLQSTGYYVKPKNIKLNGIKIGCYINLKELCAIILKNKSIVKNIISEAQGYDHNSSIYKSDLDCCELRKKRLVGTLRIELAFDDFSVTKEFHHKYFALYASFSNIPIQERLKRKDIYLVLISNRKKLAKSGGTLNDLLNCILEDLKYLCNTGTELKIRIGDQWKNVFIRSTLSSLIGDNLGAYELLGYKTNFGKAFICRCCGSNYETIQTVQDFPLLGTSLDISQYDEAVKEAERRNNLRKVHENRINRKIKSSQLRTKKFSEFASQNRFGVIQKCIFTDLQMIDIFNISPVDILHDLFEGVVPKTLSVVLVQAIKLKPEDIKDRIENFKFEHGSLKDKLLIRKNKNNNILSQFEFIICGKAVQKMELLYRLTDIFKISEFDLTNSGYELFTYVSQFCKIVEKYSLDENERILLHNLAIKIQNLNLENMSSKI